MFIVGAYMCIVTPPTNIYGITMHLYGVTILPQRATICLCVMTFYVGSAAIALETQTFLLYRVKETVY